MLACYLKGALNTIAVYIFPKIRKYCKCFRKIKFSSSYYFSNNRMLDFSCNKAVRLETVTRTNIAFSISFSQLIRMYITINQMALWIELLPLKRQTRVRFPCRVKPNTLENWHSQLPCFAFSFKGDSVETKPASSLVVFLGKALNSSFVWQTAGQSENQTVENYITCCSAQCTGSCLEELPK